MKNSFTPAPPAKALVSIISFKEHSYTQNPHSSNEETFGTFWWRYSIPRSPVLCVEKSACVQPELCTENHYRTWPWEHMKYIWTITQIPSCKSRGVYLEKDQKRVGSILIYTSSSQHALDQDSQRCKEVRYISYAPFPWWQPVFGV